MTSWKLSVATWGGPNRGRADSESRISARNGHFPRNAEADEADS